MHGFHYATPSPYAMPQSFGTAASNHSHRYPSPCEAKNVISCENMYHYFCNDHTFATTIFSYFSICVHKSDKKHLDKHLKDNLKAFGSKARAIDSERLGPSWPLPSIHPESAACWPQGSCTTSNQHKRNRETRYHPHQFG